MKKTLAISVLFALASTFAASFVPQAEPAPQEKAAPAQPEPEKKRPEKKEPEPEPKKPNRRSPWGPNCPAAVSRKSGAVRDGAKHAGQTVQADLPADQLVPNCGGIDDLGLCVFTAIMFEARLQNVPQLKNFQDYMKSQPGGGWPQKVDAMIAAVCKQNNLPIPDYIQVENGDWSLVKLALKTGRMPAITYKTPDRFGRLHLNHMVNIVKLENGWAAFRDNNLVGENEIEWWGEEEGKERAGGRQFWSVILLAPRPPMPPKNSPAVASAPFVPGVYEWRRFPELLQWSLWRDGEQVGGYDAAEDRYGVFEGGKWINFYRRPPVELPPDAFPALAGRVPGGVFFQSETQPRYSRNGVVISRDAAFAALKLEDDSIKPSLTVIGSQAQLDAFRAEFVRPENAALASCVVYQGYTPDDWAVSTSRYGFAQDGQPTIYLQQPDGEVLLHLTGFTQNTISQLRAKCPNYNPANDPGIKAEPTPTPEPPLTPDYLPGLVSTFAAAIALVILKTSTKDSGT